jgi:hypothetical protein
MGTPFLKTYATDTILCQMSGVKDKKTFRKWSYKFVDAIAMLEPIIVSNMLRASIVLYLLCMTCLIVHFPMYLDRMGKSSKRRPGGRLPYYRGWYRLSLPNTRTKLF